MKPPFGAMKGRCSVIQPIHLWNSLATTIQLIIKTSKTMIMFKKILKLK